MNLLSFHTLLHTMIRSDNLGNQYRFCYYIQDVWERTIELWHYCLIQKLPISKNWWYHYALIHNFFHILTFLCMVLSGLISANYKWTALYLKAMLWTYFCKKYCYSTATDNHFEQKFNWSSSLTSVVRFCVEMFEKYLQLKLWSFFFQTFYTQNEK